ncbi:hypothetical protein SEA_ABBA_51 [Arthrobacter phage Abba]|uniref:Uncharacterized protein n=1 Tax=Arthrobacter phage Abba TaxID=2713256 RepID=A0A6G8R2F0_9CAUD|nr:hypothetical protein HYQ28_gp51 [Arthrobacter phage Abba]QIN94380.1 hypothetical protein SEA_ABBA_51 [Arthrobacter phage Abba]
MTDRTTPGAPHVCPCGAPSFSAYSAQRHELACPTVTRMKQRRAAVAALNLAGFSITRHHRLTVHQVQREECVDVVLDAIARLA